MKIDGHKSLLLCCALFASLSASLFANGSSEKAIHAAAGLGPNAHPATITILVNDSPWLEALRAVAATYSSQTGTQVQIDATPYSGLLAKSIDATTASQSEYDILTLDETWADQFYSGGLVSSFKSIDPHFKLAPQVIQYGYITRWNGVTQTNDKAGKVYGLPINGNIQLLYYRTDIFKAKGLTPPRTWQELGKDAALLNDPPKMYGFVARASVRPDFDFQPILHSLGGYILRYLPNVKEWQIGLDTPTAQSALVLWLKLVRDYGPPTYANSGSAQMTSLMQSGRLAMGYTVTAAAPNFDNPTLSSVVGKVGATVIPGPAVGSAAPTSGIELLSVPRNLPAKDQRVALAFISWLMTKKAQLEFGNAGGIVTRQDVWRALEKNPKFWWAKAVADSTPYVHGQIRIKVGGQLFVAIDRLLLQAVANDLSPKSALNEAAKEVTQILTKDGYRVASGS